MAFGWFSKGKSASDRALVRAQKLEAQERWAEALSYYQEARAGTGDPADANRGERTCRQRLVDCNLEEAEAYRDTDPGKAREHARLALDLAGEEADLRKRAWTTVESLKDTAPPPRAARPEPPKRLFEPSCSCVTPCGSEQCSDEHPEQLDVEDLVAFYLDSCQPAEREAFEPLGAAFRAGFVHLQAGELGAARPFLEEAAREQPSAHGAHYALGLLAALEGKGPAAAEAFRRALELAPSFAPAAHHLGDLFREAGRLQEAEATLRSRLESAPDDAEARVLLSLTLLQAENFPEARAEAERSQKSADPSDLRPGLLLARALRAEKDLDGAARVLQGVLARKPDALEALAPLGEILLEQGGAAAERAAEVFKRCYREDPERGWWHLAQVARAYAARGWATEASEVLSRARQELPDDPEARRIWEAARSAVEQRD